MSYRLRCLHEHGNGVPVHLDEAGENKMLKLVCDF